MKAQQLLKAILLLQIMFFTQETIAENLFSWDAESLQSATGATIIGTKPNTTLTSSEKHRGQKSMQITVRGNDSGNQPSGAELRGGYDIGTMTDGGWFYYRFWMKIDSGFRWGNSTARTKASRIKRSGDVPPPIFTGYINKYSINIGECNYCIPEDPRISFDFQSVAGTGWHEYIIAVKKQTSANNRDGELHFYVDGQEIGSGKTGLRFIDSDVQSIEAWGSWMVYPYFQIGGTSNDGGKIWLDDFSTDTQWNSIYSGNPTPTPTPNPTPTPIPTPVPTVDSQAPAPPTNLRRQ